MSNGSVASAIQAATITANLKTYNNGAFSCNGGAFFWESQNDVGDAWSDVVLAEVRKTAGCSTNKPMTNKPTTNKPTTKPSTLGDWTVCSNSNQCTNQCCSGKYSGGVLKCTPVGGFKTLEGCVLQGDWTVCSNSNQCTNQCCSGKYLGGVLKCTPVGGFKTSEGCVGSGKLGDWTICTNSNQCINQCCSSKYSGGVLKCTPVGGFKPWEGCTGSATRNLRGGNTAEDGFHSAADDESTFQQHSAVEELVWDSLEYEAAAEDTHRAVLN